MLAVADEPVEEIEGDVYEAEQEEAEEVRNKIANRYDDVENYQYEMPEDYEDEEVDEEEAFNSEDDAAFGDFFKKV